MEKNENLKKKLVKKEKICAICVRKIITKSYRTYENMHTI
jgi:hypothetical protein